MNISIDPSGTGVTCIFFPNSNSFINQKSQYWTEHFTFIIENINPFINLDLTVYLENVKSAYNNYNADIVPLLKLLGALEMYFISNNINYIDVTSDQTKRYARWFKDSLAIIESEMLYKRNFKKIQFCKNTDITFQKNSYFYHNRKLTTHERDAILVYFIGKLIYKQNEELEMNCEEFQYKLKKSKVLNSHLSLCRACTKIYILSLG